MPSTDEVVPRALPDPPVAMFSGPGYRDTVWSDVKGSVAHSKAIRWGGSTAATHAIIKVSGAAEVRTRLFELHFSWDSGVAQADAESGRRVWAYRNRPRFGFILPPGTNVEFRIKEKSDYRFLTMELEPQYLLKAAELEHLRTLSSWKPGSTAILWLGIRQRLSSGSARAKPDKVFYTLRPPSRCWPSMSLAIFQTIRTKQAFLGAAGFLRRSCAELATTWYAAWETMCPLPKSPTQSICHPDTLHLRSNNQWEFLLMPGCAATGWILERRCSATAT